MRPALQRTVLRWTREWKRSGFDVGFRQGLRDGIAKFLVHQLEFKFGPLQPEDLGCLEAADSERLLRWGDRLLEAGSVAEVLAE
jgi:hypothetical protein